MTTAELSSLDIAVVAERLGLQLKKLGAGLAQLYQDQDLMPFTINLDAHTVTSGKGDEGGPIELVMLTRAYNKKRATSWLLKNFGDGEEPENHSQADKLVALAQKQVTNFFHDQYQTPFAKMHVRDHYETWDLGSRFFRTWLSRTFWEKHKKSVGSQALNDAITTLSGMASFDGQEIELQNRVARHEDAIWYDLSNEKWQSVKVTAAGWEIFTDPPTLFQRYMHQAPQVLPLTEGTLDPLFAFYDNLCNERQKLLLVVSLVTCFVPDIPHVLIQFHGPKGATKSTLARMLRRIVDPSHIKTLSFPAKYENSVLTLKQYYFAFFDNISRVSDEISDLLCRAVTGDGISQRKLYTDDDTVLSSIQRCIGLNGIHLTANASDLLERSILLEFEKIPKSKRRTEQAVWDEFDRALPFILGGVFNTLSKAMAILPSIQLQELPRMADFALWGCAIAEVLGYGKEAFLEAYYENIGEQHRVVLQEHPIASALQIFMNSRDRWEGKISALLGVLVDVAVEERIDIKAKEWPKGPQILTRRLKEVKSDLEETGMLLRFYRDSDGSKIQIEKTPQSTVTSVMHSLPSNASQSEQNALSVETVSDIFGVQSSVPLANERLLEAKNDDNGGSGDILKQELSSTLPF